MAKDKGTSTKLSLNLCNHLLIHSAAPQAPLNLSGDTPPSPQPLLNLKASFSKFLNTFLSVPLVQPFGNELCFPEPATAVASPHSPEMGNLTGPAGPAEGPGPMDQVYAEK